MFKKILLILGLLALPLGAVAQIIPAQNQVTTGPYGGIVLSTSTPITAKLGQILGSAFGDILYWTGARWQTAATSTLGLTPTFGTTSISATTPLQWNTTTANMSILQAGTAQNGYLSSTDWNLFNSKISSSSLSGTYPVQYNSSTGAISLAFGTTTSNTWAGTQTFTNSPVFSTVGAGTVNSTAAGTIYNTATSTPTVTAPITYSGVLGQLISGVAGAFGCNVASGSQPGCLSSADWSLFNNKISSTSLSGTGGTTYNPTTGVINSFSYPFPSNATTTVLGFTNGFTFAATSTGTNGIDISTGCFAVAGTCLQTFIQNATAYKAAANYATAAILAGTPTYSNGTAGVGATLTEVGTGALTVDGQSPSLGQRILVKNQADQTQNGVYTVTATGSGIASYILTRATDFDTPNEVYAGVTVPVLAGGTANGDTQWTQSTTGTITIGTSNIAFIETSVGTNVVTSLAGTTNQITASASTGAVTLSLPSLVVFPSNASSTLFSTTYGSTTNDFVGTLNLLNISGTQCLHSVSGIVSGTGSDCGSGSGSAFPFTPATNFGVNTSATTTPLWAQTGLFASSSSSYPTLSVKQAGAGPSATFDGGNLGISTSSPYALLSVGSQTPISSATIASTSVWSTAGTYQYTAPAGTVFIQMTMWGAGGAGANAGGDQNAGGRGAYLASTTVFMTAGQIGTIYVGQGGQGNTGGTGFASGGTGNSNACAGGGGGGSSAFTASSSNDRVIGAGGAGGGCPNAGGDASLNTGGTAVLSTTNRGNGGGGGALISGTNGANGVPGVGGTGANYAYTFLAGAGAAGAANANGGTGRLIITAYSSTISVNGTQLVAGSTMIDPAAVRIGTSTSLATLTVQSPQDVVPMLLSGFINSVAYVFERIDQFGHIITGGPAPLVSSCGTTPTIAGNDRNGHINTSGAVTTCTVTFAKPYPNAPQCTVAGGTISTQAVVTTLTTFTATFTTSQAATGINYICQSYQ